MIMICFYHFFKETLKFKLKFLILDRISTAIPFEIVNNSQSEQNESSKKDSNIEENEKKKFNGRYIHNHRKIATNGLFDVFIN